MVFQQIKRDQDYRNDFRQPCIGNQLDRYSLSAFLEQFFLNPFADHNDKQKIPRATTHPDEIQHDTNCQDGEPLHGLIQDLVVKDQNLKSPEFGSSPCC